MYYEITDSNNKVLARKKSVSHIIWWLNDKDYFADHPDAVLKIHCKLSYAPPEINPLEITRETPRDEIWKIDCEFENDMAREFVCAGLEYVEKHSI